MIYIKLTRRIHKFFVLFIEGAVVRQPPRNKYTKKLKGIIKHDDFLW